ncbi:RecT-like ssDNA binding protein [Gordonia phage PCoral7]|uniref:RecT-like ssDNA binding protein n=1 Tax=Gordonia phage Toast TaxID=2599852 RepID=A0A5J6TEG2_9CAUD|nr:RecT-like ssDNA annealing protein [Gordonia phage Toast]QFG08119.1 RecT-like ssDNA binding protein [Gordonia phage Toast]UVF60567.1 RecT-like ssDNA binding protein [Gordonia phage PCoral7]
MTSTEMATSKGTVAKQPTSELAIAPGQSEFTEAQVAALAQLGVQDASPGDLQVFFHQAKRTGLDPFAKQIYMIGRKTKTGGYRGEPERWETKWTIQVGIDGYRLGGRRVVNALGIKLDQDGPYWHNGTDWVDVWLDPNHPPQAAKFTIVRDGERHVGVANYAEYVQTNRDGSPNSMWKKMPANQLAKCAEAAAWRHAFPETFSGVVFEDAAHTVIDSNVVDEQPTKAGGRGTSGLAAALGVDEDTDTQDAEVVDEAPAPEPEQVPTEEAAPAKPTSAQNRKLNALFERAGLAKDAKNDRLTVVNSLLPNREPNSVLTSDQADHVITTLEQLVAEGKNSGTGDQVLVDTVAALLAESAN